MMFHSVTLAALIAHCAPNVAPATMAAIVNVESGGNSVGDRRQHRRPIVLPTRPRERRVFGTSPAGSGAFDRRRYRTNRQHELRRLRRYRAYDLRSMRQPKHRRKDPQRRLRLRGAALSRRSGRSPSCDRYVQHWASQCRTALRRAGPWRRWNSERLRSRFTYRDAARGVARPTPCTRGNCATHIADHASLGNLSVTGAHPRYGCADTARKDLLADSRARESTGDCPLLRVRIRGARRRASRTQLLREDASALHRTNFRLFCDRCFHRVRDHRACTCGSTSRRVWRLVSIGSCRYQTTEFDVAC